MEQANSSISIEEINRLHTRVTEMERQVKALTDALEFYKLDDEQSVEMEILESVNLRPATAALAASPVAEEIGHDAKCERTPQPDDTFERLQICLCSERHQPETEPMCPTCKGHGIMWVTTGYMGSEHRQTCEACGGSGNLSPVEETNP